MSCHPPLQLCFFVTTHHTFLHATTSGITITWRMLPRYCSNSGGCEYWANHCHTSPDGFINLLRVCQRKSQDPSVTKEGGGFQLNGKGDTTLLWVQFYNGPPYFLWRPVCILINWQSVTWPSASGGNLRHRRGRSGPLYFIAINHHALGRMTLLYDCRSNSSLRFDPIELIIQRV